MTTTLRLRGGGPSSPEDLSSIDLQLELRDANLVDFILGDLRNLSNAPVTTHEYFVLVDDVMDENVSVDFDKLPCLKAAVRNLYRLAENKLSPDLQSRPLRQVFVVPCKKAEAEIYCDLKLMERKPMPMLAKIQSWIEGLSNSCEALGDAFKAKKLKEAAATSGGVESPTYSPTMKR
jgi:hypothetical protein